MTIPFYFNNTFALLEWVVKCKNSLDSTGSGSMEERRPALCLRQMRGRRSVGVRESAPGQTGDPHNGRLATYTASSSPPGGHRHKTITCRLPQQLPHKDCDGDSNELSPACRSNRVPRDRAHFQVNAIKYMFVGIWLRTGILGLCVSLHL